MGMTRSASGTAGLYRAESCLRELLDEHGFQRGARQPAGDRDAAIGERASIVGGDIAIDAHVRPPAPASVVHDKDAVGAGLHFFVLDTHECIANGQKASLFVTDLRFLSGLHR